jgi:hypothetical protein
MSYAMAAALQAAIYQRLRGSSDLDALVGDAVFDTVPAGAAPGLYVLIGPEEVIDRSDKSGAGAEHRFIVSVVSDAAGFQAAKTAAVAVSDALADPGLVLSRGRLVGLWFLKAVAKRTGAAEARRIDLTFRARVEE